MEIVIGIGILLVSLVGTLFQRNKEKAKWNNGVCKTSGKPWKRFSTDSHGGRGYTDNGGNYLWISYKVDN